MIRPVADPIYAQGHLAILKGNLSPEGLRGQDHRVEEPGDHRPGAVFDDEQSALAAIMAGKSAGDVMVLRYLGPKGGPACRRCSRPPAR